MAADASEIEQRGAGGGRQGRGRGGRSKCWGVVGGGGGDDGVGGGDGR